MRACAALGLALTVLTLVSGVGFHSSRVGAQSARERFQQDLEQVFTAHEDVRIDPQAAAEQVRETGRMSLRTQSHDFEMQLRPNDLRAPNYRAEEVGTDGLTHSVTMSGVTTYKGNLEGVWASDARFALNDNNVEGMIITPGDFYYVEPAQKYSTAAQPTDYVVYKATDVRPEITRSCGDTLEQEVNASAKQFMSSATAGVAPAVFSPFKVVEIATDADFEYTNALGGSSAANQDILGIMNSIQAIYERDIGLTFTVTFQHTWTTADPYGAAGTGAGAVLNAFTSYWNQNFTTTQRDVAHLWTGKNLGGPNGVAWVGVVCLDPASAYGISDLETMGPFKVTIPAHEIGHNFNASHCDGQAGCDNSIMVATQTQSNTSTFCQFSVNEITNYVNANSGCLSTAAATNPIDDPTFFVKQHYLDFLNRQADQSGLDFWVGGITSCGADQACIGVKRIDTSAAFFLSIEFQQTGYLVERTYKTAFADAPGTSTLGGTAHQISVPIVKFQPDFLTDLGSVGAGVVVGQSNWEAVLERNKVAYFANFVTRKAFTDKYGPNMLPTDYVHTLNQNAGSPLSPTDEATLAAQLLAGTKSRADVLRQIAEHPTLAASEFNRAFVLMQYFGYLRRNPNDKPDSDYTGYEFWLNKLQQFGDYRTAEMVKSFLIAREYRARFGTP